MRAHYTSFSHVRQPETAAGDKNKARVKKEGGARFTVFAKKRLIKKYLIQ